MTASGARQEVLQVQSPASHNQMLGHKIPHPPSTKFDADFETPAAKRLKRQSSTDSSISRQASDEDDIREHSPSRYPPREIPDSEAESEEDEELFPSSARTTELESALPPIKTDKEAIAEYEATRAAEEANAPNLHARVGQRKWVQGKSSIYVDAFNLALETVLEDESHLFDEAETAVFEYWRELSYEAQYLYVRLFLRKTAAWHRVNRLGYYGDIADIPAAAADLFQTLSLPETTVPTELNPGELEPPADGVLGTSFTFADRSEDHINTLEEASGLLKLDELKAIAKDAKVQGKNKKELLQAFRRTSQTQRGLGWAGMKRSETDESFKSEASVDLEDDADSNGMSLNRDLHFLRKILAETGPCIRLSAAPLKLFERVHLVFYRSTEWTEKSLTTIILARISRRVYPEYIVSRSANIFPSRSTLLEFEASIRIQFRVDSILEMNGTVTKDGLLQVKQIFEQVYPRWKTLLISEQLKEDRVYESGEGAYIRRFSPAWVYTRIIHKALYPLARFKEHAREHALLVELLDQTLFHAARRGAWYQRRALLEEHYMGALSPRDGRAEDAQKKHWKRIALQTCEEGLQDRECHLIYHHDLQKRILKLERALKVAKRHQHQFTHVALARPVERYVDGIRLERPPPPLGRRSSHGSPGEAPRKGGRTVWLDEREGGAACSVEAMCLSWYRARGWKGYHSEGGILRTLFACLFADILYAYAPNVFQTPFQSAPLDLHTDAFYGARRGLIKERLAAVANGGARAVLERTLARYAGRCVVGLDWGFEAADLREVVGCFGGVGLAVVCEVLCQEYAVRGGGVPDLFLWRVVDGGGQGGEGEGDEGAGGADGAEGGSAPEGGVGGLDGRARNGAGRVRGEVMFAEVKSAKDRLSDTQRLWINVLVGAGIRVELCNAVARELRPHPAA